jgi:[protein-PII] uridylyltransferase
LLASVARILHQHRVNVRNARINTLGNRAEDVFVLEGEDMEKTSQRLALEQDLLQTLKL